MKTSLKFSLAVAAMATMIPGSSAPVFARGGAGSIMNSPGYQRRLQESRQQLPQPALETFPAHRGHKSRHRERR